MGYVDARRSLSGGSPNLSASCWQTLTITVVLAAPVLITHHASTASSATAAMNTAAPRGVSRHMSIKRPQASGDLSIGIAESCATWRVQYGADHSL